MTAHTFAGRRAGADRLPAAAQMLLPVAGVAVVVAGWWAVTAAGWTPRYVPPPAEVLAVFRSRPGLLARNTAATAVEAYGGFAAAAAVGVLSGILLALHRWPARAAWPVIVGLDAIPKLAFAPLLLLAFGFGWTPKLILAAATAVLPILLATYHGVTSTPTELEDLARSLRGGWWRTLVKIRLPYALPQIFVGLRIAVPLSVIGATIGEFFGALDGLGHMIRSAGYDTIAQMYAAMLLLAALSMALFYFVVGVERLVVRWQPASAAA